MAPEDWLLLYEQRANKEKSHARARKNNLSTTRRRRQPKLNLHFLTGGVYVALSVKIAGDNMKLTNLEKESIFIFNEAEPVACVSVKTNSRLRRRLEQLHRDRPDEVSVDDHGDYLIPKTWIKINPKHERAPLTEEQRQTRARQLELARSRSKS